MYCSGGIDQFTDAKAKTMARKLMLRAVPHEQWLTLEEVTYQLGRWRDVLGVTEPLSVEGAVFPAMGPAFVRALVMTGALKGVWFFGREALVHPDGYVQYVMGMLRAKVRTELG